MKEEIVKLLNDLKKAPNDEGTDHLLILNDLYWEYNNGVDVLKPIVKFYLNGYDDLPTKAQKKFWNDEKYKEITIVFIENHSSLVSIVDDILHSAHR